MANYDSIIEAAAQRFNVDPALIRGVIATESTNDPNAVSDKGATGLMQIMPSNYKSLGITDPKDPTQNINGGAQLLSQLLDTSPDVQTALRRYQGGEDQSKWGPVNAAYPGKVLAAGGIGNVAAQTTQPATLPGIPTKQTSGASDDDIFSAFSGGKGAPQAQQGQNDEAIFQSFSKAPAAQTAQQSQVAAQPSTPAAPPHSAVESFAAGLGHGFGSTVLGAQQLLGHGLQSLGSVGQSQNISGLITGDQPQNFLGRAGNWLVNDANQGLAKLGGQYNPYSQAHPIVAGAGDIGGSVAATLPLGVAGAGGAGVAGTALRGALTGGVTSALAPVDPNAQDYGSEKLKQIGLGAVTGGILSPVANAVGGLISPNVSPEVQTLMHLGVTPTPGQIAGGGLARTEEKLTSVPVLGDMIKNAQQRAVQQFNRATYQDALDQIGAHLPADVGTGSAGVNYVRQQIGNEYDAIANRASFVSDQNFNADLTNIRNDLAQTAPGTLQQFDNVVQNQITDKLRNNALTGNQWNDSRSMIANLSRRQVTGNASADNWALHDALDDLTTALNNGVARSSSPDVLADLQNANAGWARYKQIEKAAGSTGASNNGNVFSPAQYTSAIRLGSTQAQRGTNAGLNADLGNAAQTVLGSKYPDSGTAGRALITALTTGGLGAGLATAPLQTGAALAGVGLASLPYTPLGQRAAAALLTARPQFAQPVGNAVARLGRVVVPGSLPALLSGSQ
jgi:hypothetical protein